MKPNNEVSTTDVTEPKIPEQSTAEITTTQFPAQK